MTPLIKYTLTVQFSIKDFTRKLHNTNLLSMKSKKKVITTILFHEGIVNFYQKITQNLDKKVNQQQNTVCLEQQIYARESYTNAVGDVGDI